MSVRMPSMPYRANFYTTNKRSSSEKAPIIHLLNISTSIPGSIRDCAFLRTMPWLFPREKSRSFSLIRKASPKDKRPKLIGKGVSILKSRIQMVIEMIVLRYWSRLLLKRLGLLSDREVSSWKKDRKTSNSNKK